MKNIFFTMFCLFVLNGIVFSQYTTISSNVSSNTTWTTGTTYYVPNDIEVNNSATLTIEPGVVVKFAVGAILRNYATISAIGTSGSRIYFTSINDNSVGETITGSTGSPAAGDWDGILLYQHSGTFDYCNIYYGGNASGGVYANIQFYFCTGNQFTNGVSRYSSQYGIRAQQVGLQLTDNDISDNALIGFYHTESTGSYGVNFSNNTFNNNGGYAASISGGYLQNFSGNSGTGNTINGFAVNGTLDITSLTLSGYSSSFPLILNGQLVIKSGQTLILPAGTVIKAETNGLLTVSGTLDVNGTSSNRVVFTSSKDDYNGGDTYGDGSATSPAPGDWIKIAVTGVGSNVNLDYFSALYGGGDGDQTNILFYSNSAAGTISNCEFMYSTGYGIWANEATFTVRYSRLANNDNAGIYIRTFTQNYIPNLGTTTDGDWGNNDFDGNTNYAIINYSGNTISAYRNYWGASSDAAIAAKINNISGTVLYNPWIDSNPLPVELTSFSAKSIGNEVHVNWITATEVNNYGFKVERKSLIENYEWKEIGFVEGNGNSNSPKEYSFVDNSVLNGKYQYRLKQIDIDGNYKYSEIVSVEICHSESLPEEFALHQNYPNPFNPSTVIRYSLPVRQTGIPAVDAPSNVEGLQNITLKVYDILGNEVATLVNENQSAGNYKVTFNGSRLSSGVYLYRLQTSSGFVSTKKLVLLK